MKNITIEILEDGNIEQCRELCNELMAFQKSKATMAPENFDAMNFDTRMKKSYENSLASQVIVAKFNEIAVGYAFSTLDKVPEDRNAYPEWAPVKDIENCQGFYPEWDSLPNKMGCLSNLYVRNEYHGMGLGSRLFAMSMEWIESFPDVDLVFTYVSNGNDAALNFYLRHGFTFSHDVFGGFIKALYKFKNKK